MQFYFFWELYTEVGCRIVMNSNLRSISRLRLSSLAKADPVTWSAVTEEISDQSRKQHSCLVKDTVLFKPLTANLTPYKSYHSREWPSGSVVSSQLRECYKLTGGKFCSVEERKGQNDLDRPRSCSVTWHEIWSVLGDSQKFRSIQERFDCYRVWPYTNQVLVNINIRQNTIIMTANAY